MKFQRITGVIIELPFRFVKHIRNMEKAAGLDMDRESLQSLPYHFAEMLGIQQHFTHETRLAGYDFSFIRQCRRIPLERSEGVNRQDTYVFSFCFLIFILTLFTTLTYFQYGQNGISVK